MLYIDGKWVKATANTFQTYDLMDESVIWEGAFATTYEVDTAIQAAQEAFPKWKNLGFEKRATLLESYKNCLEKSKMEMAETISLSMGKPLWEALGEVGAMIGKFDISKRAYLERTGEVIHSDVLRTTHKPHGVCAIFSPFNFPGHLINAHLIPALLAGNCVVIKGSEKTPLVSEKIFSFLDKCHFPQGVVNLIQGGAEAGKHLASHDQIDALFFTGSYDVGSKIQQQIKPGKLLALELGGNNPLIVGKIKDIEAAVWTTIQSAYLTSGQRCTSARRLIIVEDNHNERFLKQLIEKINALSIADYRTDPQPFMGPVVDRSQAINLLNAQEQLIKQGATVLKRLTTLKDKTPLLSPALLDVTPIQKHCDEELFGPLLQIYRVPNFETALHIANQTKYGPSATLLSHSKKEHEQYAKELKVGILNWNTPTCGASSLAPFGGCGLSGNYHPSGYYAADYCSYPVAQSGSEILSLPDQFPPGVQWTK